MADIDSGFKISCLSLLYWLYNFKSNLTNVCLHVVQGHMNGARNELTRIGSLVLQLSKGQVEASVRERMILFTQPLRSGRIWHMVNF